MQNKKSVFIIGSGGSGRELESWFNLSFQNSDEWQLVGYIDDNPAALECYLSDYKILGSISDFEFKMNDYVILSIADPNIKEEVYQKIKNKVNFFTYIDPSAILGKFIEIGEGSIICPQCVISTNVKLGKFVYVNIGSQIGHDCTIGDFSSLMPSVDLGGGCILHERVLMGTKSLIIPRRTINSGIMIGAGAIVTRNLKKIGTYFGNPAVII